jgi:hypothetical protein
MDLTVARASQPTVTAGRTSAIFPVPAPAPARTPLAAIQPSPGPWASGQAALLDVGTHAAHLAAFQHVVLPAAADRLPGGTQRAAELRRSGQQLMTVLYWLDRHLTGDARATRWPGENMAQEIGAAVGWYARQERALLDDLARAMDQTRMARLIRSYHQAARYAPTRPHPHLRFHGPLGRVTLRLAGFVDDVRDGTDNRPAGSVVWANAARALNDLEDTVVAGHRDHAVGSAPTPALAGA